MSQLSLSHTLVAGTAENINDVQDNFDDISTWANGSISDSNFDSASGMYASYRPLLQAAAIASGGLSGTRWFAQDGSTAVSGSSVTSAPSQLAFNSADYTMGTKTQRLRVRGQVLVNGTAPAITFTFGLYPISSVAGAANVIAITLGTVVSGSTIASASPGANTVKSVAGSDFAVPASGNYVLGVALSGALTANSVCGLGVQLQTRFV